MQIAIVYDSSTGTTAKAAESMGKTFRDLGHECHVLDVRNAKPADVAQAELLCIGSWVQGLFVIRQHPTSRTMAFINGLGDLTGKQAVVFCTYKIAAGRTLPVRTDYQHLWTSFGTPERGLFELPESREPDRRWIFCGPVRVRASGLRLIENFLDLAHFPYVHTDILGSEAHPEVAKYEVEQRRDVDELWATKCEFYQPDRIVPVFRLFGKRLFINDGIIDVLIVKPVVTG